MCVVSNVGRYWEEDFEKKWPNIYDDWKPRPFDPDPDPDQKPAIWPVIPPLDLSKYATKEDIEQIRNEMIELKELLKAAIRYDEKTAQPHCENEDKIALIKAVATAVGVDLSDLSLN